MLHILNKINAADFEKQLIEEKIDNNNKYIKRIKKEFETAYPDEKGLLESNIIHLHLKRHGNGKFVIFGVNYDSVFYVLAFDPGHEFNKF